MGNVGHVASMANRTWKTHGRDASKALERLVTGLKLNRAADDAAGLGISEKMKAELAALGEEQKKAADAAQAAKQKDSTYAGMQNLLGQMRELAAKAASDTFAGSREALNKEYQQLQSELDRLGESISAQETKLFAVQNASSSEEVVTFSGGNLSAFLSAINRFCADTASQAVKPSQSNCAALADYAKENAAALLTSTNPQRANSAIYEVSIGGGQIAVRESLGSEALGLAGQNLLDGDHARKAMDAIKAAAARISSHRGEEGAVQQLLEYTQNHLAKMEESLTQACARITDADMAKEMTNFVKAQALQQASAFASLHAKMNLQSTLVFLFPIP